MHVILTTPCKRIEKVISLDYWSYWSLVTAAIHQIIFGKISSNPNWWERDSQLRETWAKVQGIFSDEKVTQLTRQYSRHMAVTWGSIEGNPWTIVGKYWKPSWDLCVSLGTIVICWVLLIRWVDDLSQALERLIGLWLIEWGGGCLIQGWNKRFQAEP